MAKARAACGGRFTISPPNGLSSVRPTRCFFRTWPIGLWARVKSTPHHSHYADEELLMQDPPTTPSPRRDSALRWVLIIIVVLCLVGAGILYSQWRGGPGIGRAARKALQGPTATLDLGKGVNLDL